MPQPKKIIGIDLRVRAVKVIEAEKGAKGFVPKKWGMAEIPSDLIDKHPEFENAKSEALKKLLRDNKINVRDANVVVGGSETIIRKYSLLDTPPAEIANTIKWKLAEEIPFPIEEAIFDFYPIGIEEKGKPQHFIAACISKKIYLELRQILK
ncbi:MAG: pilus assembly protein PilM, partial [Candidatus Margulisiibacteriota bacterium]